MTMVQRFEEVAQLPGMPKQLLTDGTEVDLAVNVQMRVLSSVPSADRGIPRKIDSARLLETDRRVGEITSGIRASPLKLIAQRLAAG
jgi:hypothetical protein